MDNKKEPAGSNDDDCPMIMSVYSLSEGIVTTDSNPSMLAAEKTGIISSSEHSNIKSSGDNKQQIKSTNRPPMSPAEILKQFRPGNPPIIPSSPKVQLSSPSQISVRQNLSLQSSPALNMRLSSLTSFRPRMDPTQFPRPSFPPPQVSNPGLAHFSPRCQNYTGPGPPPPHVIIGGTTQVKNLQPTSSGTYPTQPTNIRPLSPHELILHLNKNSNRPPNSPIINESPPRIPTRPKPPHTITQYLPPPMDDSSNDQCEPMQVDPPAISRPLAPHELLSSGMLAPHPSQGKTSYTTYQPQRLPTFQPHTVEWKIVTYLKNCDPSSSQSALQIANAIGNRRKTVDKTAKHLTEQGHLFIVNNTPPYLYTLNQPFFDSPMPAYSNTPPMRKSPAKRSISQVDTDQGQKAKRINKSSQEFNMDPVSLLAHICSKDRILLNYQVIDSAHKGGRTSFVMHATVGDKVYSATGSNKKDAKRDVSDLALKDLLVQDHPNADLTSISSLGLLDKRNFHSEIAAKSQELFLHVISQVPEAQAGRKVFACILLETPTSRFHIVSVGSGTRCCNGSVISCSGDVIHDTHAEIIARRALVRFLLLKLKEYFIANVEHDLFTGSDSGKVKLRDGFQFHLYISHAPCGDSAIFVRSETEHSECKPDGSHNPTFNNKNQGLLRTKIEEGEGTLPCEDKLQTVDGILRGSRLRVMSCSDKVGRWNVLGFQGALLSHFLDPLYLSSLTLGTLYHHGHLARAICCRFNQPGLVKNLKPPFHVMHPLLGTVSENEEIKRHVGKASSGSLNWTPSDSSTEFLDGGTGRPTSKLMSSLQQASATSRLSKSSLLKEFREICRLSGKTELLSLNYRATKSAAVAYQEAKAALSAFCKKSGLGVWSHLPTEVDEFD